MCIHLPTTAVILWKNKCKKVVSMVVSREQNLLAEKQGLMETFFYSRLSVYLLNVIPDSKNYIDSPKIIF